MQYALALRRRGAAGIQAAKREWQHPPLVFFTAQRLWIVQPRLLLQHLRQNLWVGWTTGAVCVGRRLRMNHVALQRNSSSSKHHAVVQSKVPPERSTAPPSSIAMKQQPSGKSAGSPGCTSYCASLLVKPLPLPAAWPAGKRGGCSNSKLDKGGKSFADMSQDGQQRKHQTL